MKNSRAILFAIIFIGAIIFFLLTPKQIPTSQNFNLYNLPILIAVMIWVGLKVLEIRNRKNKK